MGITFLFLKGWKRMSTMGLSTDSRTKYFIIIKTNISALVSRVAAVTIMNAQPFFES